MTAVTHVDATFFVQVEADRRRFGRPDENGDMPVEGAKAVRITQSRPGKPVPGTVLVKLTVRVPVAAFAPLRPEALMVIPGHLAESVPVVVEAEDPARPQDGDQ